MSYVYLKSEPGLWTVGYLDRNGSWISESDHESPNAAAARCNWLNGDQAEPSKFVLTCVFCGKEYPQGTPAANDQVLVNHIRICEKHPLRQAEADRQRLLDAAFEVIDCRELGELRALREVVAALLALGKGDKSSLTLVDAVIAVLEVEP